MPVPLWVPLAELGVAALAAAVAIFLLHVGRGRAVNRNLALVLGLEALAVIGIAGSWLAVGNEGAFHRGPFFILLLAGLSALPWFYLRFLSVLDTPLTAWLRRPRVKTLLVLAASFNWVLWAVYLVARAGLGSVPWRILLPYYTALALSIIAVAVFALVASVSAWRRTRPATLERSRARAFTAAFGIRDGLYAGFGVLGLAGLFEVAPQYWPLNPVNFIPLTMLVYMPLLAYGVLKTQLFDIHVHLRRGVRVAFMSAVFLVVLVAVFELLEDVVTWQLGWAAGFGSAVVLTFGVKPVERVATRLAHQLVTPPDPAALEERKRGVYRVAFREVWQDGRIEPHERQRLTTLGADLGLAPREMAEIEDAVIAERPLAEAPRAEDADRHELSSAAQ